MKNTPYTQPVSTGAAVLTALILLLSLCASPLMAGTSTWTGGGENSRWSTPANWSSIPVANDRLIFTQTVRLVNTNTFDPGTAFNGISFASPAGAFVLWGNSITLAGGITNDQVVTEQTINLPLSLSVTPTVDVATNASLTLAGNISGGFGITKVNGGTLTLAGTNSFTGPLIAHGGTIVATADQQLGAVPGSPTAGRLVLDAATLSAPEGFTIDPNRGIALGPVGGADVGTFDVPVNQTLTYRGVIANNTGGTGGLTKLSFGGLTLSGTNTYTGPTAIKNGTLTLDFTQPTSPTSDIINSSSVLSMGGATAGGGVTNYAALIVTPKEDIGQQPDI